MYPLLRHAETRMAQRGLSIKDAELITLIGTEVEDGFLVLAQDCRRIERELKGLLDRVRRLQGKRLVVADGRIVTAYRASQWKERRLLRSAQERDLHEFE
jgi:hypothetical protein